MFYTALLMGFAGSLHCIGMCSPLVMMVSRSQPNIFIKRLIYNVGRILPYGMLGMIAGTFGSFLQFPQFQFWLTLSFGIILLLVGITGVIHKNSIFFIPLIGKVVVGIKVLFSKFLSRKSWSSFFVLGTLNGLIPCGLTYIAASYCFLLPSAVDGFLFMITFGLGTLPAMIGFPSIATSFIKLAKLNAVKIMSAAVIILGCSVIARAAFLNHGSAERITSQISNCR